LSKDLEDKIDPRRAHVAGILGPSLGCALKIRSRRAGDDRQATVTERGVTSTEGCRQNLRSGSPDLHCYLGCDRCTLMTTKIHASQNISSDVLAFVEGSADLRSPF
jgi:hypothetical protein